MGKVKDEYSGMGSQHFYRLIVEGKLLYARRRWVEV